MAQQDFGASKLPEHSTEMYAPLSGGANTLGAVPIQLPPISATQFNAYGGCLGYAGGPAQQVLREENDNILKSQLWMESK